MDWEKELQHMLTVGCSDSAIEDYIEEHPDVNGKDVWDYVYEFNAPSVCRGCKYVQCIGFGLPCTKCLRNNTFVDRYEKK